MKTLNGIFKESTVFILLLLVALVAVWLPTYLVQGDGPAHVYNSKILLDVLRNKNIGFYSRYYDFVFLPSPNWFTHFGLTSLQIFFSPFLAEKIFLSFYVIIFPVSFRFLVRQVNSDLSYGSLLIFPLIFHFLYFFGFYNYCFGIAFALLFVGCWLYCRQKSSALQLIVLFPLSALVYFTSPLGWFLIAVLLTGFWIKEMVALVVSKFAIQPLTTMIKEWVVLALSAMIPFFLSVQFVERHISEAQFYPEKISRLWDAFFSFEMINTYSKTEELISRFFVYAICLMVLVSLIVRHKNKKGFTTGDTLLVGFILILTIYLLQPVSLSIAGFWIGRMSWLPWLLLIVWLCSVEASKHIKIGMGITGALVFISALLVRIPFQLKNSAAEEDYLSAVSYISENSTVLPLSFNNFGVDEGGKLLNETWFFQHAFDYSGAQKPNINLVNYEATTPWFPVQWKQNNNPYKLLGCTECQPPRVELDGFAKGGSDWSVDYVVTWCMEYVGNDKESVGKTRAQLEKDFDLIYVSSTKRTVVWRNKNFATVN